VGCAHLAGLTAIPPQPPEWALGPYKPPEVRAANAVIRIWPRVAGPGSKEKLPLDFAYVNDMLLEYGDMMMVV
jgi:hypothetical protein